MDLLNFHKCLADETRLRVVLLIADQDELCVCELISALQISQPKISRHLALLRQHGVLQDRRQGQWVYYRLNPNLPAWAIESINAAHHSKPNFLVADLAKLQRLDNCC
ncbi:MULTISPECIES: metalloregulator ArsR/SmtB family transcription factor [unclassified Methylophaga]|jgi:ArsR family transcriptional regulator|uniref:metalloregulator ArsR/SmtB family transcription factor n=1 Tax=unclassified Methylophaga TaxID=2629249 RepID=UPI000C8E6815|nr:MULTISPECIES: metalloregulator ArsR/SmtB family transcription factor [unclassified Methylophaga]MAK65742.1 ArsR family transcriptional regulator [Methylophaga sp.]MAY16466.1 ArsR family transcriptional regulator [Methylophaga sp.]MBN45034.1 ArsR family transcriptional regulator [Methylophaga sp.]HCD05903.1 ArsR family transcriptional regulator [Methylophaga sp.]|tara:strand:- start:73853 stop:74176 length:324 start_codon:yes stop_codon:yes gene_type:complete